MQAERPQKPASRRRATHCGRIDLGAIGDRAWLAALIVGDGSIHVTGKKNARGKKVLTPMVSVVMCDKHAIQRAAELIGVTGNRSGKTPITERRLWRVQAMGARALEVIDLVRPFLTATRIRQANRVIRRARSSGFRTRAERKEQHRLKILRLLELRPGASTRHIQGATKLDVGYARRYLHELEKEGKIRNAPIRAQSELWNRWFRIRTARRSIPANEMVPGSQSTSLMLFWRSRTSMRGVGREPRLESIQNRAWLAGLMDAEGTTGAFRPKRSSHYIPRIAIRMLDKEAIRRAAALMAVACVRAGRSKGSGRQFWQANAVGARAIRILDMIRPHLSPMKAAQADRAIGKARRSGFRTIGEMQAASKESTLQYVRRDPGSLTTQIVKGAAVVNKRARKYLAELESEGKIKRVVGGTPRKPNSQWYPV